MRAQPADLIRINKRHDRTAQNDPNHLFGPQSMTFSFSRLLLVIGLPIVFALGALPGLAPAEQGPVNGLTMHVFMSETCPHCRAQKPFLANLDSHHPALEIRDYEIMTTRQHHDLLRNMAALHGVQPGSVPMIFVGGRVWVGDSRQIRREIADHVEACLSESGCPH